MINIRKITDEDMHTIMPKVFSFMNYEFKSIEGKYYKYETGGNEFIINRRDPRIVVMWEEEGQFLYTSFYITDDYRLMLVELDNYMVDVTSNLTVYYDKNSSIQHSIGAVTNINSKVYNSVISYTQWNLDTDLCLSLYYEYLFDENKTNLIYPYQIESPQSLAFIKKMTLANKYNIVSLLSKKYVRIKAFPDDDLYERFMKNEDPQNNGRMLTRYLRWYGKSENVMVAPFGRCWKQEELEYIIRKNGFNTTIPEEIVNVNNNGIEDYEEFLNIANSLKELDKNLSDSHKLTLEMDKK